MKGSSKRQHNTNEHLQYIRQSIMEELRQERLNQILKEFEKYPKKYRTIIWMTILKLPYNRKAYNDLVNKIKNENVALVLFEDYGLEDKNKMSLLVTTLGCLIEWCPSLAQVKFLPRLVFPFLIVYQKNPLLAFELILNILLNYCQKWFEYHPLPPLNILGIIENILLEVDPSLVNIFCEHGITSSDYAWPLMQSVMSEVLSASEWLILWDHLISYQQPCLFLMCIVAYNVSSRGTIISILHSKQDFKKLYSMPSCIRAKELLKVAMNLDLEIPYHIHPSYYFRNTYLTLPSKGPYPSFTLQEYSFFTKNVHLSQINKSMEQELMQQESKHSVMKHAEKSKICSDSQASVKNVQQAQLSGKAFAKSYLSSTLSTKSDITYFSLEAQKSFQRQVCNINKKLHNLHSKYCDASELKLTKYNCKKCNCSLTQTKVSERYRSMRHNVKQLESEVGYFINSLRTKKFGNFM